MSQINSDLGCCGIQEIEDICDNTNHPEDTIRLVARTRFDDQCSCAYYIFSDIGEKKAGKNLVKYIKKNKLGNITKPPTRINPNTDHSVTMWIWAVDKANFRKYWAKINQPKNDPSHPWSIF